MGNATALVMAVVPGQIASWELGRGNRRAVASGLLSAWTHMMRFTNRARKDTMYWPELDNTVSKYSDQLADAIALTPSEQYEMAIRRGVDTLAGKDVLESSLSPVFSAARWRKQVGDLEDVVISHRRVWAEADRAPQSLLDTAAKARGLFQELDKAQLLLISTHMLGRPDVGLEKECSESDWDDHFEPLSYAAQYARRLLSNYRRFVPRTEAERLMDWSLEKYRAVAL